MSGAATILEQIRPLVRQLSAEERLVLIRSITQIDPIGDPRPISREQADEDIQQQMLIEQEAWFAQPESERIRYRGRSIAIRQGQVIDQDVERRTLLRRVRARFGNAAIPVISGDDDTPLELVVHSPQRVY